MQQMHSKNLSATCPHPHGIRCFQDMMTALSESIDSHRNDHFVHIYFKVQGKRIETNMNPIFELLFLIQPERR